MKTTTCLVQNKLGPTNISGAHTCICRSSAALRIPVSYWGGEEMAGGIDLLPHI
jgi:hypothetical protein